MTPPPIESIIAFALALCILVGCLIYDREGTVVRLRRIVTLGITRKPKKERLLSPWEIAAIEIECGIEPSWEPPPVASLVTRPPTEPSEAALEFAARFRGQQQRVAYLPPGMEMTYINPPPMPKRTIHLPDGTSVVSTPTGVIHLPPTTYRNERH